MSIVMREADRLNSLITEFLHFARAKPPQLEHLRLRLVLDEVIEVFGYLRYQEPGQPRVEVAIDMHEEIFFEADPRQLKQVFWNLLNTAAESMTQGGTVRISSHFQSALGKPRQHVVVNITDEGCGIPPDVMERIFDPFFTTKDRGSGLGLAQVHRMVEDHDGQISVTTHPERGSTFTVTLPAQPVRATLTPSPVLEVNQ